MKCKSLKNNSALLIEFFIDKRRLPAIEGQPVLFLEMQNSQAGHMIFTKTLILLN